MCATAGWGFRRRCSARCSSRSARPNVRWAARRGGWGWGWRWCAAWFSFTGARSRRGARGRVEGASLSCDCRWGGVSRPAEPVIVAAAAPVVEPPPRQLRVLIVEDNADSAASMNELLGIWGHEASTVGEGRLALELARTFHPDVVLLDIGLPDLDGYSVARQLRADPVLEPLMIAAITGYGQREDLTRAREVGIDYHFPKPINLRELRALLARCTDDLNRERSPSKAV